MKRPLPGHTGATVEDSIYWRRIARDPAAEQGELRKLFHARYLQKRNIIESLAANPATPPEMLLDLMEEAAPAFCRNATAPLITLEMPDFVEKASELGIARMLRSERAPKTLVHLVVDGATRSEYLRDTAQQHIAFRDPLPSDSWEQEVRRYLQYDILRTEDRIRLRELAELVELGGLPRSMVPHLEKGDGPETFEQLIAQVGDIDKQQAILQGRRDPYIAVFQPGSIDKMLVYKRIGATFHPDVGEEILAWAGQHLDVATAIARNPAMKPNFLTSLAKHTDVIVRRALLRNPASHPDAVSACQQTVYARALHESNQCLKQRSSRGYYGQRPFPWMFKRIIAMLSAPEVVRRPLFRTYAQSPLWEDRLAAALAIGPRPNGQPERPKHHILLERLAADGHVMVRATAQARLRGETFTLG